LNNTNHWINLGWNRCFGKIGIFGSPCGTIVLLLSKLCWYRKCMDDFWFLEGTVIFPRPSDKHDSSGEYFLFLNYDSLVFLLPNTSKFKLFGFQIFIFKPTRGRQVRQRIMNTKYLHFYYRESLKRISSKYCSIVREFPQISHVATYR